MSGIVRWLAGIPKATDIGGFKVQTSVYGSPIPIVYGTARVAGNLIHMPAIPTLAGKSKVQSKGASGGTQYTAPIIIGLSEGPIGGIGNVWRDKDAKVDFATDYTDWTLELGAFAPTPWSVLTSDYPTQALGYQYTSYVANPATPLPNDSMSSYSWEVQGFLPFGAFPDASPADIVPDLFTSEQYGLGLPSARLGDLTDFQDYCAAFSTFVSPVIASQSAARDTFNELLEVSNTGAVWSDGTLKLVPYGDVAATANGHTFTPNTTPLYDLTDANFLPRSGDLDPILVTRKDIASCFNQVTVEYEDRTYDYNVQTYVAQDQGAIATFGLVPMPTLVLHSIKDAQLAQQVAQLRLQREQNIRNTYQFNLGWRFSLLEPMDLVTLTDAQLGLDQTVVRIVAIEELADEAGFAMTAEDWPYGNASATLYGVGPGSGTAANANVDPGDTNTPIITEAPIPLSSSPLDIWIGASGGQYWGGCDVYFSVDNTTFQKVGTIVGAAAMGTLTASLASGLVYPNVDTTHTLAVDISASRRTLSTYSSTDFNNLIPLCYVEGLSTGPEWVAYETATLTSAGHYDLTTLFRGLYASTLNSHASGKTFMLIDDAVGKFPWPQGQINQVLYVKLPAFNIYGAALQDLASVSSFSHTIIRNPTILQDAIPQGTVAIDSNGNYGFTADLPTATLSFKWLASTGGYPTDALTVSTGTLVNLSGAHVASVASAGTLNFGDTAFITIVPFTGASATILQQQSIHIRGSYLTYTASKTVTYNAAGTGPGIYNPFPYTFNASGELSIGTLPPASVSEFRQLLGGIPGGTTGVMLTQVAITIYSGLNGPSPIDIWLQRNAGPSVSFIANVSATVGLGYQTLTASLSENTSGRGYAMFFQFYGATVTPDEGRYTATSITYTMTDPKQTT